MAKGLTKKVENPTKKSVGNKLKDESDRLLITNSSSIKKNEVFFDDKCAEVEREVADEETMIDEKTVKPEPELSQSDVRLQPNVKFLGRVLSSLERSNAKLLVSEYEDREAANSDGAVFGGEKRYGEGVALIERIANIYGIDVRIIGKISGEDKSLSNSLNVDCRTLIKTTTVGSNQQSSTQARERQEISERVQSVTAGLENEVPAARKKRVLSQTNSSGRLFAQSLQGLVTKNSSSSSSSKTVDTISSLDTSMKKSRNNPIESKQEVSSCTQNGRNIKSQSLRETLPTTVSSTSFPPDNSSFKSTTSNSSSGWQAVATIHATSKEEENKNTQQSQRERKPSVVRGIRSSILMRAIQAATK